MLTIGIHGIPDPRGNHGHAHDHALALIRDGKILANLELERFTRIKHDGTLPEYFDELIQAWLMPGEELKFVLANGFYGNCFRTVTGSLQLEAPKDLVPNSLLVPIQVVTSGVFREHPCSAWAVSHEAAHIGTCLAFFGSFLDDSLLVHVDGGASVSSHSCWLYRDGKLNCLDHDWDELKLVVNYFNDNEISRRILGLSAADHLAMPGKLMGFSSHGKSSEEVIQEIRSFSTSGASLQLPTNNTIPISGFPRLTALWKMLETEPDPTRISECANFAASMQTDFENTILTFLDNWKNRTSAKHLYYSGGAALNIHANTRIENESGFERLHIPPCPSDCGLALGAAALLEWTRHGRIHHCTPFLSSSPGESPSPQSLNPDNVAHVARLISAGKVVGTCLGAGETGPRALGHRSLLARPDNPDLTKKMSCIMKQREWYRPVAPMMLPEIARQALVDYNLNSTLANHMLGAWKLNPAWESGFFGVVHVDGTVRAQVVSDEWPELAPIYALLLLLYREYDLPGVINTSFNSRGEPIVQTCAQAKEAAKKLKLDALWLEKDGESCVMEF